MLSGKPFEFVEIYDDPSLQDVALFSFTNFHGLRGIAASDDDLKFYSVGFIPAWYLISPKGKVELAGSYVDAGTGRESLLKVMKNDAEFREVPDTLSPQDKALEDTLEETLSNPKAQEEWERILQDDPENALAIVRHATALAWAKGYSPANKDLKNRLGAFKNPPPAALRMFQIRYGLSDKGRVSAMQAADALRAEYPDSIYLKAYHLPLVKTPEDLTPEDMKAVVTTTALYSPWELKALSAYGLELQGDMAGAEKLYTDTSNKGMNRMGYAGFLHRQGKNEDALKAVATGASPAEETANATEAWKEMLRQVMVENWPQAVVYARQYQKVRPEKATGLACELLAAVETGDQTAAKELRLKLEEFLASNPRYAPFQTPAGASPTRDDLGKMTDENGRFDLALAAYLFARMDGDAAREKAVRHASLTAFSPSAWQYALLFEITRPPLQAKP